MVATRSRSKSPKKHHSKSPKRHTKSKSPKRHTKSPKGMFATRTHYTAANSHYGATKGECKNRTVDGKRVVKPKAGALPAKDQLVRNKSGQVEHYRGGLCKGKPKKRTCADNCKKPSKHYTKRRTYSPGKHLRVRKGKKVRMVSKEKHEAGVKNWRFKCIALIMRACRAEYGHKSKAGQKPDFGKSAEAKNLFKKLYKEFQHALNHATEALYNRLKHSEGNLEGVVKTLATYGGVMNGSIKRHTKSKSPKRHTKSPKKHTKSPKKHTKSPKRETKRKTRSPKKHHTKSPERRSPRNHRA